MVFTQEYIREQFERYNEEIFGGRLPLPEIVLTDAATFLGKCESRVRSHPSGRQDHYDFKLRFSTRQDLPTDLADDVIIHEMIHYFIMYNNLRDTAPHGTIFKGMMYAINREHGRHIQVSHRCSPDGNINVHGEDTARERADRKWRVIALLRLSNGGTGIKVIPRQAERILQYRDGVTGSPTVRSVEFFFHDDPYFARYPSSYALKYHPVDQGELSRALAGARRISIRGRKVEIE